MNLNEFQENIKNFEEYPTDLGPYYLILGAQSELGKLSEKLKTFLEENSDFNDKNKRILSISIGDTMFYLLSMANSLNISFEQIAALELRKRSLYKEQELKEKMKAG